MKTFYLFLLNCWYLTFKMVYGYLEIHLYSYEKYSDVKWWLNGKNIKFRAEDTLSGVIFIRYIQSQRIG